MGIQINTTYLYFLPLISFLICCILTPIIKYIAHKRTWIAQPSKNRWHKKPTALFGGIAIYISISIILILIANFSSIINNLFVINQPNNQSGSLPQPIAVIWIGITFLFILGTLDDFIQIKPQTKLIGQILIASFTVFLGYRLHWFSSLTLDTIFTTIWIIGITNAFNLLDNMDGLCAGIGLISLLFLALLYLNINPAAMITALVIAGSLAGFLIFNYNPASIFMGDSGSLLIGYAVSVLCLCYPEAAKNNSISIYAVPVLILLVPIFDTTMVTLIRLLSGRKASIGGKDHTSHRLVIMGLSEKKAVLVLYGIGIISGLSALFINKSDTFTSPVVIIPIILSILLMGIYLAQIRIYPEKEFSLLRGHFYTPILLEITYKKQLILVILDFFLISFSYYLSYRLTFTGDNFVFYFKIFLNTLPAIIVCKFIAFFAFGIYRGIWQYLSISDVWSYLKASALATIITIAVVTFIYNFHQISKSIFLIDFLLTTGFILGSRFSFRIFLEAMNKRNLSGNRIAIYGAGRGGELLLREITNNKKLNLKPVGFLDDDELILGKKLLGYPILGNLKTFDSIIKKNNINGIIVSFSNFNDTEKFKKMIKYCEKNSIFIKRFSIQLEKIV